MKSPYIHHDHVHNTEAASEILPVVFELTTPKSLLDVGCGTGTWLKVAESLGVEELTGIEGPHLDQGKFQCPKARLIIKNLIEPFDLKRRFDLVLCLEVAEHLPPEVSEDFVASLVRHSDNILFSAAIPFQGGQNHLNEQWPHWWQELFERHSFKAYDILRTQFWNNEKVFYWYKQNMILYSKNSFKDLKPVEGRLPSLVHPDLFIRKARQLQNLQEGRAGVAVGLRLFLNALYRLFKK
jgi:SAM-dependent methyltransferase